MSDTHNTRQAEFDADLAYLRSLSEALLKHADDLPLRQRSRQCRFWGLPWPRRIEIELVEDMSVDARRAVFSAWPTFDFLWATS